MALTEKLSAIGDAIRKKTGKTDLLTLDAMPLEIANIETGGGGSAMYSGEFTPAENVREMDIDVGGAFTNFCICATKPVTGYGVKSTGFAFADFNTPIFCGGATNNSGTSLTVFLMHFSLKNGIFVLNLTEISKTENTIAIKGDTAGNNLGHFIGGITYKWYAW